jgi:hypothetical protein
MSQENVEIVVRAGLTRWRAVDYDFVLDLLISNSASDIERGDHGVDP